MSTPVSEDAQLALINLDGGENSWTPECLDNDRIGGASALQAAAPVNGGYAVRNGCGEKFFLENGNVRRELTEEQRLALMNGIYPGTGFTEIIETERGAQIKSGPVSYSVDYDPSKCTLLTHPRVDSFEAGCNEGQTFTLGGSEPTVIRPLPGTEGSPFIQALCGFNGVFGTLSDGSYGVGLVQDGYARPMAPAGSPVSACRDGRYTW